MRGVGAGVCVGGGEDDLNYRDIRLPHNLKPTLMNSFQDILVNTDVITFYCYTDCP